MADPLSIATGCLAVIETIGSTVLTIRRFLRECREAEADLRGIHDELTKLETIFLRLRDKMLGPDSRVISPHMRDGILSGIGDCKGVVSLINSVVARHHGHPYRWVRTGKSQVAGLQSSLERYRNVLQLAISTTQLSLLISVKTDTESTRTDIAGLREDVRKLLAEFGKRKARDSDCESIITVEAEKVFEGPVFSNFDSNESHSFDNKFEESPIDDGGVDEDYINGESRDYGNHDRDGDHHSFEKFGGYKSNHRKNAEQHEGNSESGSRFVIPEPNPGDRVPQYKILYRTEARNLETNPQCVAITPDGSAIAMSSMRSITVWDLTKKGPKSAPLGSQILFDTDSRLRNTHVAKNMALIRGREGNIIIAASSSITELRLSSRPASYSKLVVHDWTSRKKLLSEVSPRSSVDIALGLTTDRFSNLVVSSLSSGNVHLTTLNPRVGSQGFWMESKTPLCPDLEFEEHRTRISRDGKHLLTFTKEMAYLIDTSPEKRRVGVRIPRGSIPVTGLPIEGKLEAIVVLWHDEKKEIELCHMDSSRESGSQLPVLRTVLRRQFSYAGGSWQRYAISPDGVLIAACTSKSEVAIFDTEDGVLLAELRLGSRFPNDMGTRSGSIPVSSPTCRGRLMAWSVDGQRLVAATVKGVEVFDVEV